MSEARWSGELHNYTSQTSSPRNETSAEVFHLRLRLWSCDPVKSGSPFGLSCFFGRFVMGLRFESTPDLSV